MKKVLTAIILTAGIVFSLALGSFEVFADNCEDVRGKVIRLHIPANSDSDEDQAVKLELRDHVLEKYGGELSACTDMNDAQQRLSELLPDIERESDEFLKSRGFTYGAKAELATMYFSTREYDKFTLPAGEYKALRITLGSGEGHNWWCVIFPQLCIPAASDQSAQQTEYAEQILGTFGTTENSSAQQGITVKFALYEWLDRLINGQST